MSLAKRMREFREDKGLKINECAKELGVSVSTYRDWEYGRSISGEPYEKIAHLLGVSLSKLFGHEEILLIERLELIEKQLTDTLEHVKSIKSKL